MNIINICDWFEDFCPEPLIIAGPCSAETEQQVLNTAKKVNEIPNVKVFRSGIWKPRTRPGSFEGVGEKALNWLQKVKQKTDLKTTVEVATKEHIDICLKNRDAVDILWIGARTSSNPFSVQECANALKGVNIPVLIKNPINPDLNLWIGAIERFYKAGIKKLGAIHRGFYPFEKTELRNIPKWEIPIELKIKFPNLPVINDPSHISGDKDFIEFIAQKAMALNMDGLMIETHIDPENALSDSQQQITPEKLRIILKKLVFRKDLADDSEFNDLLEQYREQIDSIDFQILELLSKRMNIVENIGYYKDKNAVAIFQLKRWINIIKTRQEFGKNLGLSDDFIKMILQIVHNESIRIQTKK